MGAAANELVSWLSARDPAIQSDERLFEAFLEDEGIPLPEDADSYEEWVKANHMEDFSIWLDNAWDLEEKFEVRRNNDNIEGTQELGSGTWLLHYTPAEFTQFSDGVTREHLGQSRVPRDRKIACPDNLTLPPEKQKWVHAFPVFDEYSHSGNLDWNMLANIGNYGYNALLFQSDEAVYGKHVVHEEYMAFVLGCSEYNAVLLTNLEQDYIGTKHTLRGTAHLATGEVEFEDIDALIDVLEKQPRAMLGGFGGARRTRWHRLARRR